MSVTSDVRTLLIAGTGPDVRGWLFAVDASAPQVQHIEEIDHLNTSGIVTAGKHVYRILSSASEANATSELLTYDEHGVTAYHRLSGIVDPHALIWNGRHFVVPCSFTNEIRWLTPDGQTTRIWRAPGDGDAWHVNGVHLRDGRLFASAFGTFATHRGWRDAFGQHTGLIFDVETQRPVIEHLDCPHDPLFVDGKWLVCDSYTRRLLAVDESSGIIQRRLELSGWTRGLAITDDFIFVGVSGARHGAPAAQLARLVVIRRADWEIIAARELPCAEISALALVDTTFLPGLRRGFRTNELRVAVADRHDLLESASGPGHALALTPMKALTGPRDARVRIAVNAPRRVDGGAFFDVAVRIKNRGRATLFTAAPFPVNVAVVFVRLDGAPGEHETRREPLPGPLGPGVTIRFTLRLQSPALPGRYRVRFTLVQEWVRWFDDDTRWRARLLSTNRRIVRLTIAGSTAGENERRPAHI